MSRLLLEQYIKAILKEDRFDPHTKKCVLVLGPAGVGKSSTIKIIRAGNSLKYLNSDQFLEIFIDRELAKINKDKPESQHLNRASYMDKYDAKVQDFRKKASELNDKRLTKFTGTMLVDDQAKLEKEDPELYSEFKAYESIDNNLGIVIEGTASSSGSARWFLNNFIRPLKARKYQIFIVGVYAPLYVCMKRNRFRGQRGGRELTSSHMQSVFYGFINEYSELIKSAKEKNLIWDALTILNMDEKDFDSEDFVSDSKEQLLRYIHMVNHPNSTEIKKLRQTDAMSSKIIDSFEDNKEMTDEERAQQLGMQDLARDLNLLRQAEESSADEKYLIQHSKKPEAIGKYMNAFLRNAPPPK